MRIKQDAGPLLLRSCNEELKYDGEHTLAKICMKAPGGKLVTVAVLREDVLEVVNDDSSNIVRSASFQTLLSEYKKVKSIARMKQKVENK